MNSTNLPPLPTPEQRGSEVCAKMALYIAVWQDLTPAQKAQASRHIQTCETCAQEFRYMESAVKLIARLSRESTVPSARVDQAVMRAIAARHGVGKAPIKMRARSRKIQSFSGGSSRMASWAAVAAAVLVVIVGAMTFIPGLHPNAPGSHSITTQAFKLPANLSWNSEVLYHVQTWTEKNGNQYQMTTYYDPNAQMSNVEVTMGNSIDTVLIEAKQSHQALAMDMMHHVAQWNPQKKWVDDESMFDLKQLRSDLQTGRAVYLGKSTFQGQQVYQIRWTDNQILLLDMNYTPVNVLQASSNSTSGLPEYVTMKWLKSSSVPDSTWNMSVPPDFKVGTLST